MTRVELMDELRGALSAAKSKLYVAGRNDETGCLLIRDGTTGVEYTLVIEDGDTTRVWRRKDPLRGPGQRIPHYWGGGDRDGGDHW